MTMRDREPVHVDITNKDSVSAAGGVKITSTRWDPSKGAAEAQALVEARVREQFLAEQQREEASPINQRFKALEARMAAIEAQLNQQQDG